MRSINGVDLDGLAQARAAIKNSPESGVAQYGVSLDWAGGVRMNAKALPMRLGEEVLDRGFEWTIDEPPQLLGNSGGPTPQEYLMSGVAACIMVGFVVNAAVSNVAVEKLTVRMSGSLDLAGFLNLREGAQVKMSGLDYEIEVVADAPDTTLQDIASKAFNLSPNAMTVLHGTDVSGEMRIVRPG